jgi:hypothetical protein
MKRLAKFLMCFSIASVCSGGASAATKPAPMQTSSDFPAIGKEVRVDFDGTGFMLRFHNDKTMSFVGTSGKYKDAADTVEYTAVKIRPGLYMVYWIENIQQTRVVHIEDYDNSAVYTNIAAPDGEFSHMRGTLEIIGSIKKEQK